MWAFVLTGACVSGLDPLTPGFLLFAALGIGAHLAGMATRRLQGRKHLRKFSATQTPTVVLARQWRRGRRISVLMLLALALGVAFFLHAYAQLVPSLDAIGLVAMRNVYLDEVKGTGDKLFIYTTHLTLLGIVVMYFMARNHSVGTQLGLRQSRVLFNMVATASFCAGLLTTGRTAPLLVIICYTFYCLRFRLYTKNRIVGSFFALSIAMFFLVALALGKEGLGDDSALSALGNLFKVYFFSAPAAMQAVFVHNLSVTDVCSNIFSYPVDLAKKFGYFQQCDVRDLDFVFVPVATNVFTFLRSYWEDFGWGYPVALFCVGYLIEANYEGARRKDGFAAFIYPFVLNSLLLQIFEEQLFANGSVFAYLAVFYLILRLLFIGRHPRRPTAPGDPQKNRLSPA